jgi:hypothetical protein
LRRTESPGSQSQSPKPSGSGNDDKDPSIEGTPSSIPFNVLQLLNNIDDVNAEVPIVAAFDNDEEYQKALEAHLEYLRDKDKDKYISPT